MISLRSSIHFLWSLTLLVAACDSKPHLAVDASTTDAASVADASTDGAADATVDAFVTPDAALDGSVRSAALGMNDVSVLLPLGTSHDAPGYLKADSMGARGVLLPQALYDQVPMFPAMTINSLSYARMRVLGIRFDPCGGPTGACNPQIRLVLQPVNNNGSTRDSALHIFYDLEEAEMATVVRELRELAALGAGNPVVAQDVLDVNPSIVAQGMEGAYATRLNEILLAHCGEQNIIRMTFFLRAPPENDVWFFGGLDRNAEGTFQTQNIVGLNGGNQEVLLTPPPNFRYQLIPAGDDPEMGEAFLSRAAMNAATAEMRQATMASYMRVENPVTHRPDDLSCAGCHLSSFVTSEATRVFDLQPSTFNETYTSERNLTVQGTSRTSHRSLRAFGYFGRDKMIAQRTVNETAEVLDTIERLYPASN